MMEWLKRWWVARKRVEHIQVVTIPEDAYLAMTVNPDFLDVDVERLRSELKNFFGKERKIAIVRAGDVQWSVVRFEKGSADADNQHN